MLLLLIVGVRDMTSTGGASSGGHIGFSGNIYFPECFHRFYQTVRSGELVYKVSHFYPNVQIYYITVLHYKDTQQAVN